jgi:hypothetical protein
MQDSKEQEMTRMKLAILGFGDHRREEVIAFGSLFAETGAGQIGRNDIDEHIRDK